MCSVIPVGENTPRGNGAWGGDHTGPEHGLQPSTAPEAYIVPRFSDFPHSPARPRVAGSGPGPAPAPAMRSPQQTREPGLCRDRR